MLVTVITLLHCLHVVLERMGTSKLDLLPVVSRANVHNLLGVVVLPDVLNDFGVAQYESPVPGA